MRLIYQSQLIVSLFATLLMFVWNTLYVAINCVKFRINIDGALEKSLIMFAANLAVIWMLYVDGMDAQIVSRKIYIDNVIGVLLAGIYQGIPIAIHRGVMILFVSGFPGFNRLRGGQ